MTKRKTVIDLLKMKKRGEKITSLTAYDTAFAKILDSVGIDFILVGDSLGMVFQGNTTTVKVSVEDIIYHTKIVVDNTATALVVADLPFMSYQVSVEKGIENSFRIMKETGCSAVKMEGATDITLEIIRRLTGSGVPVYGHLGLTPQSINQFGSYKLRAKKEGEANKLLQDSKKLQDVGVSGIILEKIPAKLAKEVTDSLLVPTIGIAAGNGCDGQVLVITDMLGLDEDVNFKFVRKYANLSKIIKEATEKYIEDVRNSNFPSLEESY